MSNDTMKKILAGVVAAATGAAGGMAFGVPGVVGGILVGVGQFLLGLFHVVPGSQK